MAQEKQNWLLQIHRQFVSQPAIKGDGDRNDRSTGFDGRA
jgi:hypothetical protein